MSTASIGIISAALGFYVGKQPDIPSYMRNGACGEGTPYRCHAPDVPVLLPDNPPGATAERPR